jgi:DNA-binding XRE family transcriptional regulator
MNTKPSDIIARKRADLGLSQQAAATLAGISIAGWQSIERGLIENPTIETARAIAHALDCSIADIWTWVKDAA